MGQRLGRGALLGAVLLVAVLPAGCGVAPPVTVSVPTRVPLPTPFPTLAGGPSLQPPAVPTQGRTVEGTPFSDLPEAVGTLEPGGFVEPEPGQPAPDIVVAHLDTNTPFRLSDLKGKPVWLNFWATWCPPCRTEMPVMQQIYQQHRDSDLVILGVDAGEYPDTVRQFVADGGFGWTFALDVDNRAALTYLVLGLPAHFFIARDGTLQDSIIGEISPVDMEAQVARLLQK